MELERPVDLQVPSPVCAITLRVHAFRTWNDTEVRCRDCGLIMPLAACLMDGPDARHCLQCGWWSPEDECRAGDWCVWCKAEFDE